MDADIKLRATQKDKAQIKIKAQAVGKDVSAYLRDVLIKNHIIDPV